MNGMSLAESAVLLCFHTIGMIFLLLGRIVITILALCTSQGYLSTHCISSLKNRAKKKSLVSSRQINIAH